MHFKSEKGFTGSDTAVALIIIFIFISVMTTLSYNFITSNKELERRSDATDIAIDEIEQIKNNSFNIYEGKSQTNNNSFICENQAVEGKQGYYKTIEVVDYADITEGKQEDIVKKVIITISYKFKNQEQKVELSTVIAKEN